jgi:hypothetical protein
MNFLCFFFSRWQILQQDHVHLLHRRRALLLPVCDLNLLLAQEQLRATKVTKPVRIKADEECGSEGSNE